MKVLKRYIFREDGGGNNLYYLITIFVRQLTFVLFVVPIKSINYGTHKNIIIIKTAHRLYRKALIRARTIIPIIRMFFGKRNITINTIHLKLLSLRILRIVDWSAGRDISLGMIWETISLFWEETPGGNKVDLYVEKMIWYSIPLTCINISEKLNPICW